MSRLRVLFYGDSITDAGRDIVMEDSLGQGYPLLLAAELGMTQPGRHAFFNRGISGNQVTDLLARLQRDVLDAQPDVLSVLVGINDVAYAGEDPEGRRLAAFIEVYDRMLKKARAENPGLRLLLMAPFVLKGSATGLHWEMFERQTARYARAVQDLAAAHQAVFVPLQAAFDEALQQAPASHWLRDGVHPSPAGHALIAREWKNGLNQLMLTSS